VSLVASSGASGAVVQEGEAGSCGSEVLAHELEFEALACCGSISVSSFKKTYWDRGKVLRISLREKIFIVGAAKARAGRSETRVGMCMLMGMLIRRTDKSKCYL
jgi:hypothetical protein